MPFTDGFRVQLIISGVGGESGEAGGGDGIMMHHVYATCVTPFALGIPADKVQLYCGPNFIQQKGKLTIPVGWCG